MKKFVASTEQWRTFPIQREQKDVKVKYPKLFFFIPREEESQEEKLDK